MISTFSGEPWWVAGSTPGEMKMLNQDQIERLAEAIEGAAKKAGFEWLDDSYTESLHLPPSETPYTHGCGLIEDLANELGELLVKVRKA